MAADMGLSFILDILGFEVSIRYLHGQLVLRVGGSGRGHGGDTSVQTGLRGRGLSPVSMLGFKGHKDEEEP